MRVIKLFTVLVMLAGLVILPAFQPTRVAAQGTPPTSFADEFDSATLDPAWQVVAFTGTRVYGYPSPANHISLTVNPGYLRYSLDPMTYSTGFLENYQTFVNVYPYDPGLELHRLFSGEHWVFETKAHYYMPYTNGRGLEADIYFGDGGAYTFEAMFTRYRDVGEFSNDMGIILQKKTGPSHGDMTTLESLGIYDAVNGPAESTYSYRLERDGGVLTASWSSDGVTWNPAWSRDMGSQLDGLQQRLVIVGVSWFSPAGSYADYDYVRLTPTDVVAPTVGCVAADGQWHADDVSIACTASDSESGLANTADASFSLSTSVPADSETADATTGSRQVCDVAGNCATAGPIAGNKVDKKMPTISPAIAAGALGTNGWYTSIVTVHFTCADGAGSGIPTSTCPADQVLSMEGAAVASTAQTVTDAAGNTSAASNVVSVKIDKTKPTLSPTVSPNPVLLNGTATVTSGAADALSGLASQSCGALVTSSVGAKSVTCTATDNAGNSNSAMVNYNVNYNWSGFFQPVDNLPTLNSVKAGSAIPVKFSLAGNQGLSIFAASYPVSQKIACDSSAAADDIEETSTAGGSSLSYDAGSSQYNYVWKTDKGWAGTCRQLIVRLIDGTDHKASFQFK